MSVTKELRKWACTEVPYKYGHQLLAIADRIDEEHLKACKELVHDAYMRGKETANDAFEEMQGTHVKLPVDADGIPIHIGDVMEWCDSGDTLEVVGIGDDTIFYIDPDEGCDFYALWTAARNKRHHAPTVEDVLREFANEVYADADNEIRDRDFICAKYAKRLQLQEDVQ